MKPVTIVDITEPLQDGDFYAVTVEMPDESQAAIVWPRFCATCMRVAVMGSELSRIGYYEAVGGQGKMVRRIVTRVPYCSDHQTGPSRKDLGFYLKLLVAGLLGLMTGILLTFLGSGWPDLRMYGGLVILTSAAAICSGGYHFIEKLIKPDAVGLEIDPKGLEVVFLFRNVDYGRKFVEANPSRGEVVLSREDESIMITGSNRSELMNESAPVGHARNGVSAVASGEHPDVKGDQEEGGVSEEDFMERTSPSFQVFPAGESFASDVPIPRADVERLHSEAILEVEDMDALGFEEDESSEIRFSEDFATEDDECTVADMYDENEAFAGPEPHSKSHSPYPFVRGSSFERQTTSPFGSRSGADVTGSSELVDSSMSEAESKDPPPPSDVVSTASDSSGLQEDLPHPPPGFRKK